MFDEDKFFFDFKKKVVVENVCSGCFLFFKIKVGVFIELKKFIYDWF